ncbi:hypothetical protein REPUB_Repub08aG0224300 [Reevesia pubescens]
MQLPEWVTDEMKFELGDLGGCLSMSLVNVPHGSFSTESGHMGNDKIWNTGNLGLNCLSFHHLLPLDK